MLQAIEQCTGEVALNVVGDSSRRMAVSTFVASLKIKGRFKQPELLLIASTASACQVTSAKAIVVNNDVQRYVAQEPSAPARI
jgi:hypothetical protein